MEIRLFQLKIPLMSTQNVHKSQLFQLRCGNFPARHSDTTAPCGPCSLAHLSQMHWTWGQLLHSWRTVPGCSWKHALERGMRSATGTDRWAGTDGDRSPIAEGGFNHPKMVTYCGFCEILHQLVYGLSPNPIIYSVSQFGEFPPTNAIQHDSNNKSGGTIGIFQRKTGIEH